MTDQVTEVPWTVEVTFEAGLAFRSSLHRAHPRVHEPISHGLSLLEGVMLFDLHDAHPTLPHAKQSRISLRTSDRRTAQSRAKSSISVQKCNCVRTVSSGLNMPNCTRSTLRSSHDDGGMPWAMIGPETFQQLLCMHIPTWCTTA